MYNWIILLYICLENSTDRGAWQTTVHGVVKSRTWLRVFHFHFTMQYYRTKWLTVCWMDKIMSMPTSFLSVVWHIEATHWVFAEGKHDHSFRAQNQDFQAMLGLLILFSVKRWAFQVALVVKNPPANAGDVRDVGSIPESGRSPRGGNGNSLQYSCLENPIILAGYSPRGCKESDTTEET